MSWNDEKPFELHGKPLAEAEVDYEVDRKTVGLYRERLNLGHGIFCGAQTKLSVMKQMYVKWCFFFSFQIPPGAGHWKTCVWRMLMPCSC